MDDINIELLKRVNGAEPVAGRCLVANGGGPIPSKPTQARQNSRVDKTAHELSISYKIFIYLF